MPFSEENKAKIRKNYDSIVNDLSLNNIMDKLIPKNVLSFDDRQRITAEKTQSDMNRKFIDILLKRQESAYDEFIKVLRTDEAYKDLADQIEKTEVDIQELTPTTLESWIGEDRITPEKKITYLSDLHILHFSKAIKTSSLLQVASILGIPQNDVDNIQWNNPRSADSCSHQLLIKWRNKKGCEATAGNLLEKLFDAWNFASECIDPQFVQIAWDNL